MFFITQEDVLIQDANKQCCCWNIISRASMCIQDTFKCRDKGEGTWENSKSNQVFPVFQLHFLHLLSSCSCCRKKFKSNYLNMLSFIMIDFNTLSSQKSGTWLFIQPADAFHCCLMFPAQHVNFRCLISIYCLFSDDRKVPFFIILKVLRPWKIDWKKERDETQQIVSILNKLFHFNRFIFKNVALPIFSQH